MGKATTPLLQRVIERQRVQRHRALCTILEVKGYEIDHEVGPVLISCRKGLDKPTHISITPYGEYRYKGASYNFNGIVKRLGLLVN